jgi:hypothetical protein
VLLSAGTAEKRRISIARVKRDDGDYRAAAPANVFPRTQLAPRRELVRIRRDLVAREPLRLR